MAAMATMAHIVVADLVIICNPIQFAFHTCITLLTYIACIVVAYLVIIYNLHSTHRTRNTYKSHQILLPPCVLKINRAMKHALFPLPVHVGTISLMKASLLLRKAIMPPSPLSLMLVSCCQYVWKKRTMVVSM